MAAGQWTGVAVNVPTGIGNIVGTSGAASGVTLVAPGPRLVSIVKTGNALATITIVSESLDGGTQTFNLKGEGGASSFTLTLKLQKGITAMSIDALTSGQVTFVTARSTGEV